MFPLINSVSLDHMENLKLIVVSNLAFEYSARFILFRLLNILVSSSATLAYIFWNDNSETVVWLPEHGEGFMAILVADDKVLYVFRMYFTFEKKTCTFAFIFGNCLNY